jgi:hypothetical protein
MFPGFNFVYFALSLFHSAKKYLAGITPGRHICANGIMMAENITAVLI